MSAVRSAPCTACPYRKDVPSGVWAEHEYQKLIDYDEPTHSQPFATFACHATPEHHCHGWAVVHMNRGHEYELMALRIWQPEGGIPEAHGDLFDSGTAAAKHGMARIANPGDDANKAVERLLRKHPRLLKDKDDDEQAS